MYAVIKTGGKQYRVAADDIIEIEKIKADAGDIVQFPDVLMIAGEGAPQIGTPTIAGASVAGEVLEQTRGDKVIIFKKKRRHNYRRKKGHRQELTVVRITEILTGGAKPSKSAAATGARTDAPVAAGIQAFRLLEAPEGVRDDLTRISGIGRTIAEKLNDHGIYHFWQLAALDAAEAKKIEDEIGFPGRIAREEWVAQAKELMAGAMPRAQVDRMGWEARKAGTFTRLAAAQGRPDDLSLIAGVGPKIERALHGYGIFHYWQIAAMGPTDAERFEKEIGFPGRVAREQWAEQARELMAGKKPRAKVDRAHQQAKT
jgi:large subunit ribosomal protein L21